MNIIGMRQEQRAKIVSDITVSIEKAIYRQEKINYKELVLATMASRNLSRRTSVEYIQMALFNLKLTKEQLESGEFA